MTDVRDSETETPLVGQLLVAAFNVSRQAHRATGEQWIKASFRAGGAIPESAAFKSIQRIGDLDLLCRALEDELLRVYSELSPKIGDGGNREGGISWGCL